MNRKQAFEAAHMERNKKRIKKLKTTQAEYRKIFLATYTDGGTDYRNTDTGEEWNAFNDGVNKAQYITE